MKETTCSHSRLLGASLFEILQKREQHPRWEGAYWVRTAHAWYRLLEPDAAYVSLWNATDGARLRVRLAGRDVWPALSRAGSGWEWG